MRGADFNTKVDLDALMSSLMTTGFQATQLARAINEVNKMVSISILIFPRFTSTAVFQLKLVFIKCVP